jgi:hypothetical protein
MLMRAAARGPGPATGVGRRALTRLCVCGEGEGALRVVLLSSSCSRAVGL